jgi:hypothetical protein
LKKPGDIIVIQTKVKRQKPIISSFAVESAYTLNRIIA